jgi:DNA-binding NarL/FixJ family response regulator
MRARDVGKLCTDLSSLGPHATKILASHGALLSPLPDDERQVAAVAVLEATLCGQPVAECVSRAVQLERLRMPPLPRCVLPEHDSNPEHLRMRTEMRQALAYLPPRQAIVLEALLIGETLDEVGAKLGICKNVAHKAAVRGLRSVVEAVG